MFAQFNAHKQKLTSAEDIALEQLTKLSAKQILDVSPEEPAGLFTIFSEEYIDDAYKKLARIWHPDKNKDPQANDVFAHVGVLLNAAQKCLESGLWICDNTLYLVTLDKKQLKIPFIKMSDFELGKQVLTKNSIVYLLHNSASDLFDNGVAMIQGLSYPDVKFKAGISPCLPEIKGIHATKDFRVLVIKKDPNLIMLRDLLSLPDNQGRVDSFHVAWMLSRLHNLSCYLQWAKISHQAISIDTCFIEPKEHGLALLGGWWYSLPIGQQLIGLPGSLINFMPAVINSGGITQASSDLNLLRVLCLQLLGNRAGCGYFAATDVPQPMLTWLQQPNQQDAFKQYAQWKDGIRPKIFIDKNGLIPMSVASQQVYKRLILS